MKEERKETEVDVDVESKPRNIIQGVKMNFQFPYVIYAL